MPSPAPAPLIAFDRSDDHPTTVFVVAADGRLLRPVRHPGGLSFDYRLPAWSPDGRRLAYEGIHVDESEPRIYVVGGEGRGASRAIGTGSAPWWAPDGSLRYERGSRNVARSPDGRSVAFVRGGDLYVGRRRITHDPEEERDPAWSPDSRRIAVKVLRTDGSTEIDVIRADGRGLRLVTRGVSAYQRLSWSPDGTRIAFTSRNSAVEPISVVNVDGTGRRRLTPGPTDVDAAWSPDGRWIAFAGYRGSDGHDLYVIRSDGTGLRRLTSGPDSDRHPVWQPSH